MKWFKNQPRIRGENIEVEIDDTAISKRKYLNTTWIFGGIERISKRKFIVPLIKRGDDEDYTRPENIRRTAENLLPLIQKYIAPGSIIYRDKWKAYDKLSKLEYKYLTINHSQQFVDGTIHTQNIERIWSDLKEYIQRPGKRRIYMEQYVARYLFISATEDKQKLLHNFFIAAADLYNSGSNCTRTISADEEVAEDSSSE